MSSCMILWLKYSGDPPSNMYLYEPGCSLEDLLLDQHWAVLKDKLTKGCKVYYIIDDTKNFAEDETERGTDFEGYYSFRC